ncbi:hypothetical protein ABI59_09495 [Acidobacteria bacterium Mor1]|nr:hypothetical protein ABI59_09495 [Acidobacteria bacterium Mor1]
MRSRWALALILVLLAGGTAWAEGDRAFRFNLVYSMPTSDFDPGGGETTELDESLGFEAGLEFMVTDSIGVEPALGLFESELIFMEPGQPDMDDGDVEGIRILGAVNFHFGNEKVDLFAGPVLGYMLWDDIQPVGMSPGAPVDDELIFGAGFGVNVPGGESGWSFNAQLRYLQMELSPEANSNVLGIDPVEVLVGASVRF